MGCSRVLLLSSDADQHTERNEHPVRLDVAVQGRESESHGGSETGLDSFGVDLLDHREAQVERSLSGELAFDEVGGGHDVAGFTVKRTVSSYVTFG